jgi:hypothetical protein
LILSAAADFDIDDKVSSIERSAVQYITWLSLLPTSKVVIAAFNPF